jgi:hypothetical protein
MSYYTDPRGRVVYEVGRNVKDSKPHYNEGLDNYLDKKNENINSAVSIDKIDISSKSNYFDMDDDTLNYLLENLDSTVPIQDQKCLYEFFKKSITSDLPEVTSVPKEDKERFQLLE